MLRRPLTIVMVSLVLGIFFWYQWHPPEDSYVKIETHGKVIGKINAIASKPNGRVLTLSDVLIKNKEKFPCNQLIVYEDAKSSAFSSLKIGNIILLEGKLTSFSLPGNPGQFNEFMYYKQQNIDYRMFATKCEIKKKTYDTYRQTLFEIKSRFFGAIKEALPEEEAGIVAALILGEKSLLSEDTKILYQQSGISHLLAISGLHVSILGSGLFFLLRKKFFTINVAAGVTSLFLIMYGELTGFSISTTRAVGMIICMMIGRMLGRAYDMASALSLIGIITLILNPYSLFNVGFLLSYGTIVGILVVLPMLQRGISFKQMEEVHGKKKMRLIQGFLGSFSVFLTTTPILLYFYYEIALYSVLINLVVLPFVSALVGISFFSGGLSLISVIIGKFFFGSVHFILQYYEWIGMLALKLPYHCIRIGQPELLYIYFYYAILIIVCVVSYYNNGKKIFVLLILCIVICIPKSETSFSYTMLDVGQGDGMYFHAEGKNILVDGGSSSVSEVGKYRIAPFLKWKGVKKIDYVFITHSDSDHTNGIIELIEKKELIGIDIEHIVLPRIEQPDTNYMELENKCKKVGVKVLKMQQGDFLHLGKMKLSCLHPRKDYRWASVNDYSLALQVNYEELSLLLTGDLESSGEKASLSEFKNVKVLKVGHHGSKTSSSEIFLEKTNPKWAFISAGENNRYGHPNKVTLDSLANVGAKIYSTISMGAITLKNDGKRIEISCFKKG